MRLIDADALIEEIKNYHNSLKPRYATKLVDAEILDIIDIIRERSQFFEWIPCSEGLPENYQVVNVTWVNRNPEPYYSDIKDRPFNGTAIYHYGRWYWYSCVCEDYLKECGDSTADRLDKDIEVIAWQPLPQPYRE